MAFHFQIQQHRISSPICLGSFECSGCSDSFRCHGDNQIIVGELHRRRGRVIVKVFAHQGVTPFQSGDVVVNFVRSWIALILLSQGKADLDGLEVRDGRNGEVIAINLHYHVRSGFC